MRSRNRINRPRGQSEADASFTAFISKSEAPAEPQKQTETPTVPVEPAPAQNPEPAPATDPFGDPVPPTPAAPPATGAPRFAAKPTNRAATTTHSVRLPKPTIARWKQEAKLANESSQGAISPATLVHALLNKYFDAVDEARAAGRSQAEINREWGIADD